MSSKPKSLVELIAKTLGSKSPEYWSSSSTMSELGVDSIIGAEIKESAETYFGIRLTVEEIKSLTVENLMKLQSVGSSSVSNENYYQVNINKFQVKNYDLKELVPKKCVVGLNYVESESAPTLFIIHPVEGNLSMFKSLAKKLPFSVYGVQLSKDVPMDSMQELADFYLKEIQDLQPSPPYNLAAYSFGCMIMIEIALKLQKQYGDSQSVHSLICIEGSYFCIDFPKQKEGHAAIWEYFLSHFMPVDYNEIKSKLASLSDFDEEIKCVEEIFLKSNFTLKKEDIVLAAKNFFKCFEVIATDYTPKEKLKMAVTLIRAMDNKAALESFGNDYGLSSICDSEINIELVMGNHETFLEESKLKRLAKLIDEIITE